MANILLSASFPFTVSSSYSRICDGPNAITFQGNTYIPGRFAVGENTGISTFCHGVDIYKGGGLESSKDFSYDILDDGFLGSIEAAGYSLNAGTVSITRLEDDGATATRLFFGYIDGCSLSNNILTVNCITVNKALNTIPNAIDYGVVSKVELQKDAALSQQVYKFTYNGRTSEHPKILSTTSPKNPSTADNNFGVVRIQDGANTSITIIHTNTSRIWDGGIYPYLSLKFQSGKNADKSYRVSKVTHSDADVNGTYSTKLTLLDAFDDIDIRAFDRIVIDEASVYCRISDNLTPSNVSIKIDDGYYTLSPDSYTFITLNDLRYIKVSLRSTVYREVPISVSLSSPQGIVGTTLKNGYVVPVNIANITDNYLNSYILYQHVTDASQMVDTFTITPDLSNFSSDLFLGMMADIANPNESLTISINVVLKNGEVYPCDNNGVGSLSPYINATSSTRFTMESVPIGNSSYPDNPYSDVPGTNLFVSNYSNQLFQMDLWKNLTITDYMGYYNVNTVQFDEGCLTNGKIDIDKDVYEDVKNIIVTITKSGGVKWPTAIFKVGIWAKETISDIDALYIDAENTTSTKPDTFCKSIIIDQGADYTGDFDSIFQDELLSIYDANGNKLPQKSPYHYSAESKSNSQELIASVAEENCFIVAQNKVGKFYTSPIKAGLITYDIDLSASDILSISDNLKDIDISNVINLPKFTFTDLNGETQTVELIDLTQTFPTQDAFDADNTVLNSIFEFSDNFISRATLYANVDEVYLWLKDVFNTCLTSYNKNKVTNSGSIDIKTVYLEYVLAPAGVSGCDSTGRLISTRLTNLLQLISARRKTLTLVLSRKYETLPLGRRLKVTDPRIMSGFHLLGYVTNVETDIIAGNSKVTLLIDAYAQGDGTIYFF